MTNSGITIERLLNISSAPMELLQLADPSIEQINQYLQNGYCFVARAGSGIIGVMILFDQIASSIEIKNIAVDENWQGKGIGKQLLQFAESFALQHSYSRLLIGTGNSSIGQLALYQKMGFEISGIKKNFFLIHYSEPIFENGIQCKHMIMLEKDLSR
ncbi:GNAT family N-acetyltransferase [Pseudoflavitalea sp. G-6-1-2]|uniref:GNAT family N-acetyltransferase n=1 Tax=Pseudoflavitalea sp. G-6-1-2 TaxID=2728841 RepID=UPI00146F8228|nr:GNAT family N-acetyltransferase [Pseudoflavitalea sp. G-6-1-2]NML19534.1 GNAT family N-acetyltransferase [Pseudoflavitalea sp. G-6-1-2]